MKTSTLVWLSWMALGGLLEILAVSGKVPWETLSQWVWDLEHLGWIFSVIVAGGLFILTLHLALRWP